MSKVRLRTLAVAALLAPGASAGQDRPRPNLLVCIADDASARFVGAMGCRWVRTPHFDRVAREGLLFTRAYTPNAKCAPSRACLLTGRNSWQLEAAANHVPYFPEKFKTYPEALAERGWHVGVTGKGWAPGTAVSGGKPRALTGKPYDAARLKPPASGISSNDYAANFKAFLEDNPGEKPWCFWYGALEPHRGYERGSGAAKGGFKTQDVDTVPGFWPDSEVVRNDLLDYAYELEWFDAQLGRMLALLEERGELERTLIVVTADNGMPFPRVKGQEYQLSNHLPLAVRWPGGIRNPGRKVDDYVSFIDLAPTFLEAAGVGWKEAGLEPSPGRSLFDLFEGRRPDPPRDRVLIGKERHDVGRPNDQGYPIRGIVQDGMLYLRNYETGRWPAGDPETGYLNCDGSPTKTEVLQKRGACWELCFGKRGAVELFDVDKDPFCLENLAGRTEHREVEQALDARLQRELRAQGDPRAEGRGEVFEQYPYAQESMRGYYEKFRAGKAPRAAWVNPSDYEPR